jgi:hypothetical protein
MLTVDVAISQLSFSKEGPYLETDRGILTIQSLYTGTFPLQSRPLCQVFVNWDRVARNMENFLFLPSDYRATCSAIRSNILVLGHMSGRVTFIEFSPS